MIFQDFTTDQLQRIAAATANLHGEDWDAPEAADARTATEGEQWNFTGWRMVYETALEQIASRSMTGTQAIEYARQHGLLLATVADADYGVRYGFSPEEAALQDPAKVQLDPNTIISTKAVLAHAGRCVVCGAPATHVCAGCADVRCDVHENHVRLSSCRDIGGRTQAAAFEDPPCPDCGAQPAMLTCCRCGLRARITDCGHMQQPRPIAAGRADGSDIGNVYCAGCAER